MMTLRQLLRFMCPILAVLMATACSPTYNWREVHGGMVQYSVLLPAKPVSVSRQIDLNGVSVTMTMTAAEVNGVTFAVGTAELADATQAQNALESMRTALLNNIGGRPKEAAIPARAVAADRILDVAADGMARGRPLQLMARLMAKDKRIYQVLIVGGEHAIPLETAETFFTSFKPV